MQGGWKAVWSIPYVFVAAFFPSLKKTFIGYRSSKGSSRPDCIFGIHQLWQSGFSRVYCYILTFDPAQKYYSKVMHWKEVTHSNGQ